MIYKIWRPHSRSLICLITSMITDQIGRHEVLLHFNHNYDEICEIWSFFKIKTQEISHLSTRAQWCTLSNYLGMMCTVLLHLLISAEIGTVDSQSDLRILLWLWLYLLYFIQQSWIHVWMTFFPFLHIIR